ASKPQTRIVPEAPGHEGHGGTDRFQRSWRLAGDEAPVVACMDPHQLVDDGIDWPNRGVTGTRRKRPKHLGNEGAQILPQHSIQQCLVHGTCHESSPSLSFAGADLSAAPLNTRAL